MIRAVLIAMLLCFVVGCDKGNYVPIGPVMVDKNLLWGNLEVK